MSVRFWFAVLSEVHNDKQTEANLQSNLVDDEAKDIFYEGSNVMQLLKEYKDELRLPAHKNSQRYDQVGPNVLCHF